MSNESTKPRIPTVPTNQDMWGKNAELARINPEDIPKDQQMATLAYLLFGKTAKKVKDFFSKMEPMPQAPDTSRSFAPVNQPGFGSEYKDPSTLNIFEKMKQHQKYYDDLEKWSKSL